MKKIEMITEIMNVYDENEELKQKLQRFNELRNESINKEPISEDRELNMKLILIGKEALAEKVIYQYTNFDVERDDDSGELKIETYSHWFSRAFRKDNIPQDWSQEQITSLLKDTFKDMYERKKNEAIQEFKISEQ